MKISLKPVLICILALLAVALLVTAVIFFIPRDNTSFSFECFRLRSAVSGFLKDLEKERYDDAFDRIYCVSAEDETPLGNSDACRKAWTERVSALRSGGDNTYLEDFADLKVCKENGKFTVTVTLSVMFQGYGDKFYTDGSVISVVYDDGWKIVSISEYEPGLQTPFEQAVSGRFTAEEVS